MDWKRQTHNPTALATAGFFLEVEVNIPQPLIDLLSSQNKPISPARSGIALIGAGASRACVELTAFSGLGINSICIAKVGTAGGTILCQLFPAGLGFPALSMTVDFGSIISVNLQGQTVDGNTIIVLTGRDILSRGLFVYSGNGGFFILALA